MKLSVIVCTRNRAHAIIPCLNSIAESFAHAAPLDAEIVVVDNASEDNTSAVVREWAASSGVSVNLLFEPKKGLGSARNCGLRNARGDLIVWTDDDCRLSKEYITDLLRHDAADTGLVLRGGRVELGDPEDLPITIKTGLDLKRWSLQMRSARREGIHGCIFGCNMAMRRATVDKVGLCDIRFGAGTSLRAGEDSDYIFRAYAAGITIEYVPDMVVYHHHGRKTLAVGNKLTRDYIIANGGLYAKYLFKHIDFCRPGYWTFKNAIQEIISGAKHNNAEVGFSSKRRFVYHVLGAMKYCIVSIRKAA